MFIKKYLTVAAIATGLATGGAMAATVDLGFGIDESGSINSSEFALQTQGLAAALAQIPVPTTVDDPVYRVSIVTFATGATTLVAPIEITSVADRNAVVAAVNSNQQSGGNTAIGGAIRLLTDNFLNAGGLGDASILNIGTDGTNTAGERPQNGAAYAAASGISSLSFEAIGNPSTRAILDAAFAADPDAVLIDDVRDLPDDILQTSFVLRVGSFQEYEAAISAKVLEVISDTGGGGGGTTNPGNMAPIPLPAGIWLMLAGLGGLCAVRRRSAV